MATHGLFEFGNQIQGIPLVIIQVNLVATQVNHHQLALLSIEVARYSPTRGAADALFNGGRRSPPAEDAGIPHLRWAPSTPHRRPGDAG
ncbi:hypothetical protein GCM10022227_19130 [Streptomyces sedi]